MHLLDAIVLGVVEGFTEFLPISSTAHLVITSHLLRIPESGFLSSFIIAIQLGAICAVALLYWKKLFLDLETFKRVCVAFLPTAIIGFLLYKILKAYLLDNLTLIACALFIGGVVFVVFEYLHKRETTAVVSDGPFSYWTAFWIGCAQSLAIIPGVSRAGATILAGLMFGLSREEVVEFSFLLAIPTMLAATGYDLLKTGASFSGSEWGLLFLGFLVSGLAAYASIRFLVQYVKTHSFTGFGVYRIVLGTLILAVLVL